MNIFAFKNGDKATFVRLEVAVDKNRFAQALTEYFYRKNIEEIPKLGKREARDILKGELKWFGRQGEYGSESLGTDTIDEYNALFDQAIEWLDKNYPEF